MPPIGGSPAGSPPPHPLAGTAPETVLAVEDAIRPLRHEVAVWFDLTGIEIGRRVERTAHVTFTPTEAASMKGAIVTHNHPDGWSFAEADPRRGGNSLSDDDFGLAVRVDAAELRVVTPTLRFSIKRPLAGWGVTLAMIRLYHALFTRVVLAELDLAVRLGRMTLEAAEATRYHEVARRLSAQVGIVYTRWEG